MQRIAKKKDTRIEFKENENWGWQNRISCKGDKINEADYFLLVSLNLVITCCVGATKSLARLKSRT